MKIVIDTQDFENYGAHDWNGQGECSQYWKFKGGRTYIFTGVTVEEAQDVEFWNSLHPLVSSKNEMFESHVIGETLADDITPNSEFVEEWDSPIILERRNGEWHASHYERFDYPRDGLWATCKTWIQREGDNQADFLFQYENICGERMSYRELNARWQEEAA